MPSPTAREMTITRGEPRLSHADRHPSKPDDASHHSGTSCTVSLSSVSPISSPTRQRHEKVIAMPKQVEFQLPQTQKLPKSLTPRRMRRSVSASEDPRSTTTKNKNSSGASFIKYYQIHGRQEGLVDDDEEANLPLNRLTEDAGCSERRRRHVEVLAKHSRRKCNSGDSHHAQELGGLRSIAAKLQLSSWARDMSDTSSNSSSACLDDSQTTAAFLEESSQQEQRRNSYGRRRLETHPLGELAQTLTYTQHDLLRICVCTDADRYKSHKADDTFAKLKQTLRDRGVITNLYLKENLAFYVKHIQQVEERKAQDLARRSSKDRRRKHHRHDERRSRHRSPPRRQSSNAAA